MQKTTRKGWLGYALRDVEQLGYIKEENNIGGALEMSAILHLTHFIVSVQHSLFGRATAHMGSEGGPQLQVTPLHCHTF